MTDTPRKSRATTRGKPFEPGNPGRRKGTRNRATQMAEKLMADDAKAVVEAVIAAAKAGDMTAARIVLDRIAPVRKGSPVVFTLPAIEAATDVVTALGALVQAVARGELTPDEGVSVANLLEAKRKAIETLEIERRLAALEEMTKP